jgi:hypothetical protein
MAKRRDVVADQLDELRQDLEQLWAALTHDPKQEARKQRAWTFFVGAFGALGTLAARRLATKAWAILTGETPPIGPTPRQPAPPPPTQRSEEEQREPAGV